MHEKANNLTPLQKAYLVIRDLESRIKRVEETNKREEIAVIGIACHLPGNIQTAGEFWNALLNERDLITQQGLFKRWNRKKNGTVPHAGLLADIAGFDNEFFHISPGEARYMDPQQRHMLMVAYKAFEDAAIPAESLRNSNTGIFIGIGAVDYSMHITSQGGDVSSSPYLGSGNSLSGASGRLSYFFGCNGPSLSIDTACSSSLVAIHQACNSLQNNECGMALVGGVNLLLSSELQQSLTEAGMLSADGHCKTFNDDANGYVRSEGCIALVLKRLSDAERDGDRIYACIKGSAVAQDGASGGLTVPNPEAQAMVISQAIKSAGVTVNDIDFIEAHGTGTSLGDPVEIQGLKLAFGNRKGTEKLKIGSVKTNVGHLEAAAGIAGFVKACLSVYHKNLPAHLHYNQPSKHIDWNNSPAEVNNELYTLQPGKRLMAGVSSFGFTGTVAHCIVAEHIAQTVSHTQHASQTGDFELVISAPDEDALDRLRGAYVQYLSATGDNLADICYTAATGRSQYTYSLFSKGNTKKDIAAALQAAIPTTNKRAAGNIPVTGKKVTLPNYPFKMDKHWIGALPGNIETVYTYGTAWKTLDRLETPANEGIYVLINMSLQGEQLKTCLDSEEHVIATIPWSAGNLEGLPHLLEVLKAYYPQKQVHLIYDIAGIEETEQDVVYTVAYENAIIFLKSLVALQEQPSSLTVLTSQAFKATEEDSSINALQNSIAVFFKSAALEMQALPVRLLDVTAEISEAIFKEKQVTAYIQQEHYRQLAIRETGLWYPVLQPAEESLDAVNIQADAVYLITGGNGSLGKHITQWLLDNKAGKVIAGSRSKISENTNERIIYRQLDVADGSSVASLKNWLDENRLVLKGVVHAAGISHRQYVKDLEISDIDKAFSSKVTGLQNLASILDLNSLDFFVVYSSIASVWGSGMLSHYAAANAWMDAFIYKLREQGVRAKTINWGPWADSSMMLQDADSTDILESSGVKAHTGAEVAELYGRLLYPDNTQTIFVQLDTEKFIPIMEMMRTSAFWDVLRPAERLQAKEDVNNEIITAVDSQGNIDVDLLLEDELKAVLGTDTAVKISKTRNFNDMGMDSILLMRFVKKLGEKLQVPVTTNMIFNYPTLDLLSKHIREHFFRSTIVSTEEKNSETRISVSRQIDELSDKDLMELMREDIKKYI